MQQIFKLLSAGEYAQAVFIAEKYTPDELATLLSAPEMLEHLAFLRELDFELLCSALVKLTINREFMRLKPLLATLHATELAALFEEIDHTDAPLVFRILPKDLAAETFVEMDVDLKERLISRLATKNCARLWTNCF